MIFNDRTLEALAADKPASREALLAVPGIGPAKARDYGEEILEIVAAT